MPAYFPVKQEITVGEPVTINCDSPSTQFSVVFEDDGETGYFYGLDFDQTENPICDALNIYNVQNVIDRAKPSTIWIGWSVDGLKSVLLINQHPHAVFDFSAKRGYCRSNFPPADPAWTNFSHEWDDTAIDLFN